MVRYASSEYSLIRFPNAAEQRYLLTDFVAALFVTGFNLNSIFTSADLHSQGVFPASVDLSRREAVGIHM